MVSSTSRPRKLDSRIKHDVYRRPVPEISSFEIFKMAEYMTSLQGTDPLSARSTRDSTQENNVFWKCGRSTDRQTDRQTERQIHRQTGRLIIRVAQSCFITIINQHCSLPLIHGPHASMPHASWTLCRPRCEESSHWRRSDTAWKQNYSIPALPDCLTALSTCVSLV